MCGITGAVWTQPEKRITSKNLLAMTAAIRHRGPDDEGHFVQDGIETHLTGKADFGVALGFRRLAIIDLVASRQPIANEDGSIQAVFNGEIFNYKEIRAELIDKGHQFKTEGDSETIVHLYEELGTDCFSRFNGFFSIAIWDLKKRQLILGRDRLGQKPLVYRQESGRLLFSSELKSLLTVPGIPREISPEAVDEFLTYQYVPHPNCILKGFRKLPPGHWAKYDGKRLEIQSYWNPDWEEDSRWNLEDAAERCRELFDSSIRLRMQSDVPLGAFLSGGIDSSLVVASMARQSSQQVKTFSIGFPIKDFDESAFARQVADHLKTDHHNFEVTPDADSILDELVYLYDEPFGDSSAIPTWYVSRMTKEHVTVALSGDGGDELFAGYDRYRAVRFAERIDRWGIVKELMAARFWQKVPSSAKQKSRIRQLKRFSYALGLQPLERYLDWISIFNDERRRPLENQELVDAMSGKHPIRFLEKAFESVKGRDSVTAISLTDLRTYLPCDLNTKVDIASMGNGLEVRQPFLDYRLVEFAISLPIQLKVKSGKGKYLLQKAMGDRIPDHIWTRPKMGFGVPIGEWFRGPLKDRLGDLVLDPDAACLQFLKPESIKKLFDDHQNKVVDNSYRLWSIMMLELWIRRWVRSD